ncbi:hypothetical protein TNCV_628901 [Trichonephila clavipes]|nr:hypothetical protein TNCV_628901 [Trichonephila clavipes]
MKPSTISTATQTDPNITNIICPPLECLKPVSSANLMSSTSSSESTVSMSFSSTQAHLLSTISAKYQQYKCCVKGILGTGGVMDKCVQMWTRNYGALGQTARVCFGVLCASQTREVKRDFCDLPMRLNEGRVVNTPLVFKMVLFQEKKSKKEGRERDEREKEKSSGERTDGRRRENGRKESGIGVKKTMNAGGVENGNMN